jgi:hypothetical protein
MGWFSRAALLCAVLTPNVFLAQGDVRDRLSSMAASLASTVERDVPADQRQGLAPRLDRARAALAANRLHLALYELEGAFVSANAFAYAGAATDVTSADAFAQHWKAAGEPKAAQPTARHAPLLLQALAEASEARAPVTYRASLPYGQDAGVPAGLYYLGESRALVAFADFVRRLGWPSNGAVPAVRSIAPELAALDAEVTTAYKDMTAAEHPRYIVVSVLLKRARTLNDAGAHAGALLEYLMARLRFFPLRKTDPGIADAARIAEARERLGAGTDHSIAQLFVEMAEAAAESQDAAMKQNAAAILIDVLPAYHAALARPARDTTVAVKPAVTITLVRWPFT